MAEPSPFFLIYASVEVAICHSDNLSPSPQVVDRFLERKQKMRTEAEGGESAHGGRGRKQKMRTEAEGGVKEPAAPSARVLRE